MLAQQQVAVQDAVYVYGYRTRILLAAMWFGWMIQVFLYALIGWNNGNLMFDQSKRAKKFVAWRVHGQVWGMIVLIPIFLLYRFLLVGWTYTVAIGTEIVVAAWHGLGFILFMVDWGNCDSTPFCSFCTGCSGPDWSFMILAWSTLALGILSGLQAGGQIFLRRRVELQNQIELAASSRGNPLTNFVVPPAGFTSYPPTGGYGSVMASSDDIEGADQGDAAPSSSSSSSSSSSRSRATAPGRVIKVARPPSAALKKASDK